jgi:Bax protein
MRKFILLSLVATLFFSSFSNSKPLDKATILSITAEELVKKGSNSKKKTFTTSMITIIEDVRSQIDETRQRILDLSKKKKHTVEEKLFLDQQFSRYKVKKGNYTELLSKMIVPPNSLILAQASLESGWGRSNLAKQGNNLFGMKSFNSQEPRVNVGNINYRKYDSLRDSVEDYVVNLSRHGAYKNLRAGIRKGESSIKLTQYLGAYCEDPAYGKDLVTMIKNNNFTQHDI